MGQNIYLCSCENTGEGILIDAGCSAADENAIIQEINNKNINIKAILLTHGHYDHITGLAKIKNKTGAAVYCHALEKELLENAELNLSFRTVNKISFSPDEVFNDNEEIIFGDVKMIIFHTPGHTPGGVCYYNSASGSLFSGDTLFANSIGRTDFPKSDHHKLINNINVKLLTLPDETVVYPGHGGSTTIGKEKTSNPFL
jgi:glyoxylase-like metal-dependent hydrolase (beta-lactamase superfamily II)